MIVDKQMKNALIIFAKAPLVGHVKTRLAATVGGGMATAIYKKLLNKNLALANQLETVDKILYAFSSDDAEYFKAKLHWPIHIQADGGLGHRMKEAMTPNLHNYASVVLIGVDIADAQIEDLASAFDNLNRGVDLVLGPTYDGGYWLIGSRINNELLFQDIDWGTSRVFSQTRSRLRALGLHYHCLPVRHDIDVENDLVFVNEL